jgi:hypothetical protein
MANCLRSAPWVCFHRRETLGQELYQHHYSFVQTESGNSAARSFGMVEAPDTMQKSISGVTDFVSQIQLQRVYRPILTRK